MCIVAERRSKKRSVSEKPLAHSTTDNLLTNEEATSSLGSVTDAVVGDVVGQEVNSTRKKCNKKKRS